MNDPPKMVHRSTQELYQEPGTACRERIAADLYKLAGILDKSERELGIGIDDEDEDPFEW